jgi:serine/threonine-protein kinase
MKRLTGTTLASVLELATPPRQRLLRAFADICLAVEFAHARGVVHRDLKPANIVLGDFGEVYVLDWGVARLVGERDEPSIVGDIDMDVMTKAGALVGTAGYMAPEQARGDVDVAAPADVYALGAILFEILAGESLHPRGQAGLLSTVSGIDGAPSRRRPDRSVAPELDAVCEAALADSPTARPTAHELAERVQRYLDGDRDLERRRALAAQQLATARAALVRGHAGERGDVVRAAGRALALDPESREAAELVTRLILEPPREQPAALRAQLAASDQATQRKQARAAAASFGAIFAFLAVAAWSGLDNWRLMAIIAAVTAAMAAAAIRFSRRPARSREMMFVAAGNACLVALLSRTFGPLIVIPGVTCVMAVSLTSYPQLIERAWIVIALLVASWLAPVALEYLGVLDQTWKIVDGRIISMSTLIGINSSSTVGLLIFAHVATIVVIGMFANALATSRRNAQRELEIQAWHLRQLLPVRR